MTRVNTAVAPRRLSRPRAALLMGMALLALGGCASKDNTRSGLLEPYRFDIPQGNYVTQEMLDQIKPGMSREQVRFALGSPLLNAAFRTDRWNYIYRFQHANGRADVRRVVVFFADDRVDRIEADPLPVRDDNDDPALPGYRGNRDKES
ncbi:MAG: outer membrane protein assembly factor BamE [Burkholderiaceae bacterium]